MDRFYPFSKTCAECSTKNEELTLKEGKWTCAHCGVELDRDGNAVQNIRVAGMYQFTVVGCVFVNRGGSKLRHGSLFKLIHYRKLVC